MTMVVRPAEGQSCKI